MRTVPRLCELYPGICLTTEEKAPKKSRSFQLLVGGFCFPRDMEATESDKGLVNSAMVRVTSNGPLLVTCFLAGSREPLYMHAHTNPTVMWYIKRQSITWNLPLDRKRIWTLCTKSFSKCSQFKVLYFFCFNTRAVRLLLFFCYITNKCTIIP